MFTDAVCLGRLHSVTHSCHLIVLAEIDKDLLEQGWRLEDAASQVCEAEEEGVRLNVQLCPEVSDFLTPPRLS